MSKQFQTTTPKPFIFVLMPFRKEFNDIYKFGIKDTVEEVGGYAERVDEQDFSEGILERVYNQINKADVIIADMTSQNPNVFYEVGYAHALGKITILLTQKAEDIPFDLKHRSHIVYEGIIEKLKNELKKRLLWAIKESGKQESIKDESPQVKAQNTNLLATSDVSHKPDVEYINESGRRTFVTVSIKNTSFSEKLVVTNAYLIFPHECNLDVKARLENTYDSYVIAKFVSESENFGENSIFYQLTSGEENISPYAYKLIEFTCYPNIWSHGDASKYETVLRVHTSTMFYDYPFNLIVKMN